MQLSHFQSKSYQYPPSGANSKQKDSHFDMLKDSLELSLKVRNDEALYKYIMYILYQPTFVVTGIICLGLGEFFLCMGVTLMPKLNDPRSQFGGM